MLHSVFDRSAKKCPPKASWLHSAGDHLKYSRSSGFSACTRARWSLVLKAGARLRASASEYKANPQTSTFGKSLRNSSMALRAAA
ncbi:hypothetical protein D3C86_1463390 [compost metagenome]